MEKIIVFKGPAYNHYSLFRSGVDYVEALPLINGVVCRLPSGLTEQQLATAPEVLALEDNVPVKLPPYRLERGWPFFGIPGMGRQVLPWGVERVKAEKIWPYTRGEQVPVAILDSGIDLEHPDLINNIAGGINILNPAQRPMDENGHGTHVAGTIAAEDNNFGVVGVAPRTKLYSIKMLNRDGEGTLAGIIKGLQWCVANGIRVVNLSIGSSKNSLALRMAVQRAYRAGLIMVCAAGNEGTGNSISYPAAYPEVITVGAIDQYDQLASFSSYGPQLTVVAPGSGIYSTFLDGSYVRLSGTSMAAPHVTGLLALLLSINPRLTHNRLMTLLHKSSEKLPNLTEQQQGAGLVNGQNLLSNLL